MQGMCIQHKGEFLGGKRLEAKGWGWEGLLLEWGFRRGSWMPYGREAVAGRGDDVQTNIEGAFMKMRERGFRLGSPAAD